METDIQLAKQAELKELLAVSASKQVLHQSMEEVTKAYLEQMGLA